MNTKKFRLIIATVALGALLLAGIGKLAMGTPSAEKQDTSESGLHYELPQLIPTTWIGRK